MFTIEALPMRPVRFQRSGRVHAIGQKPRGDQLVRVGWLLAAEPQPAAEAEANRKPLDGSIEVLHRIQSVASTVASAKPWLLTQPKPLI